MRYIAVVVNEWNNLPLIYIFITVNLFWNTLWTRWITMIMNDWNSLPLYIHHYDDEWLKQFTITYFILSLLMYILNTMWLMRLITMMMKNCIKITIKILLSKTISCIWSSILKISKIFKRDDWTQYWIIY